MAKVILITILCSAAGGLWANSLDWRSVSPANQVAMNRVDLAWGLPMASSTTTDRNVQPEALTAQKARTSWPLPMVFDPQPAALASGERNHARPRRIERRNRLRKLALPSCQPFCKQQVWLPKKQP